MSRFARDVVVEEVGAGRYRADVPESWNVVRFPQGGVVAAYALRAAAAAVADPLQTLRTTTTVFAAPVAPGPVDIDVTVLRRGRSASQTLVTVRNVGSDAGTATVAVFGSARRGPAFVDVAPPAVPGPAESVSFGTAPPEGVTLPDFGPFWKQVEGRVAMGHAPWDRYEPTSSDRATWLRFDEPPRMADGTLDPLGIVTLADRMPAAVGERTGNEGPAWFAPSADLTVHLCAPLRSEWLLAHDRARWADDGWASVETTLWDEDGGLVGYATQVVFFTYLDQ